MLLALDTLASLAHAISTTDPAPMPTLAHIDRHLRNLYSAWESVLYSAGRQSSRAELAIVEGCHSSGYHVLQHKIYIFVPEANFDDFDNADAYSTVPSRMGRPVAETELLHEMIHEMQYREIAGVSSEGVHLHAKFGDNYFAGGGHDASFYTAMALAASRLGVDPEQLVHEL